MYRVKYMAEYTVEVDDSAYPEGSDKDSVQGVEDENCADVIVFAIEEGTAKLTVAIEEI